MKATVKHTKSVPNAHGWYWHSVEGEFTGSCYAKEEYPVGTAVEVGIRLTYSRERKQEYTNYVILARQIVAEVPVEPIGTYDMDSVKRLLNTAAVH